MRYIYVTNTDGLKQDCVSIANAQEILHYWAKLSMVTYFDNVLKYSFMKFLKILNTTVLDVSMIYLTFKRALLSHYLSKERNAL